MTFSVRRVVTGHNAEGRAVVQIDEMARNVVLNRPKVASAVVWTTEGFPVNNDGNEDGGSRVVGTSEDNGSVFRVVSYEPGATPRNHRTDSLDYAVVISGEIDMDVDGVEVHLKAGDVLVQRGTIHNWINRTQAPCVIAFVLIGAKPVMAGGQTLRAQG